MSMSNEKPEAGKTETKRQGHEVVLDVSALEEISGGTPGQDALPLDSVADMYDARPFKVTPGREGKSGA